MSPKVLIVTIPPTTGGVPAKAKILAKYLRRLGHDVTIAHYATLTDNPDLVVPIWKLLQGRRVGISRSLCFGDFPCISVGCNLPELEFNYYRASALWRDVIGQFDRHIAVGGTVLASNVLVATGVPHFVWCASSMIDDRITRRSAMPLARRLIDKGLIGPIQSAMEKKILSGPAHFMAVSRYAKDTLKAIGGREDQFSIVPIPVDTSVFTPAPKIPGKTIGFAGRASDPRKDIPLLLQALKCLIDGGEAVQLRMTGNASKELQSRIDILGLTENVSWTGWLDESDLPDFYRSLDLFVISSTKEGLGISGVQAMASGVPVVSTRCGGPEDYVIDGETGALVGSTSTELAGAISWLVNDHALRAKLGRAARTLVSEKYDHARFEEHISAIWAKTWGDVP